MEIDRIIIKNIGPFDDLDLEINGKSIALIGENASGKTLFLSSVVDFIFEHLRGIGFQNVMKTDGNIYNYFRITSSNFLRDKDKHGLIWIFGKINSQSIFYLEEYGYNDKEELVEELQLPAEQIPWPKNNNSKQVSYLNEEEKKRAQDYVMNIPIFFLPATRFEKESWKTEKYFDADFSIEQPFNKKLGHNIELYRSFKDVYVWLTNILFNATHFGRNSATDSMLKAINDVISKLLGQEATVRISQDFSDRLCIVNKEGNVLVKSFSHLSLGQMSVLGIILNILSQNKLNLPTNLIDGLVVIDEVDAHLTGAYKAEILPDIISLFPKIQFLITTHDPLSVVGFEQRGNIKLLELPSGHEMLAKDFKEVKFVRENLKTQNEELHRMIEEIKACNKPILIVEDQHSEIYKVAWLKLNHESFTCDNICEVFSENAPFEIISANGQLNLYALLNMKDFPQDIVHTKIVGLFDFDQAFGSFNGLKQEYWGNEMGDMFTGLYKTNLKRTNQHALMLPIPYQRRGIAGINYGANSRLSIELYFSNRRLGRHCVIDKSVPGKIKKFSGNKATFWRDCATYEPSDFKNFRKIFDKLHTLFGIE